MGVEFRILGPLEVARDGEVLELGWPRQRALLAVLLIRRGEVVPAGRIADDLWAGRPPAGAASTLQGYVSRLRKVLPAEAAGPRIVTAAGGYQLRVETGELDAERFELLAAEARRHAEEGRMSLAADRLDEALGLWRGPALADFALEDFAAGESGRLDEQRLAATEDRLEAHLALGRHAAVVGELTALVEEHPLRERLRGQQILALYRAGRQADALAAFRSARAVLDELGLEPGRELRALERSILTQSDDLAAASPLRLPALPAPPTVLVGRERELAELDALLGREDARVVTLTGPGGVGKTRLALAAAAEVADGGRAAFVDLSALADPALVPAAVVQALELGDVEAGAVADALLRALGGRRLMLVLDNLEQVIDAAPFVAELVRRVPALQVLATSREPLRIAGERELAVPPLAEPAASALFLDRVRAVRSDFRPTPADDGEIAAICRRLDCLPLALELAAARVKLLSPAEVRERLDDRLDLVERRGRDVPARQHSLRAAIGWSYDLLPPAEQALFGQLSVFAGGAALEDAAAVCGVPGLDILDGIASLQDKSLVRRDGRDGAGTRVVMLETVRDYAAGALDGAGAETVSRRHAEHFLALAETAEPKLWRGEQAGWFERLGLEHDNLRRALEFFRSRDEPREELRLAVALRRFWSVRGFFAEGLDTLERALASAPKPYDRTVVLGLRGAAMLAQHQGDYGRARSYAERELAAARGIDEAKEVAIALSDLASALASQGDHAQARPLHEESVALLRTLDDPRGLASALVNLGDLDLILGAPDQAALASAEGLALFREVGDARGAAVALSNLGVAEVFRGNAAAAEAALREALETSAALGDAEGVAYGLDGLAAVAAGGTAWERAATLAGAAAALREAIGGSLEPAEDALRRRTIDLLAGAMPEEALLEAMAAGRALDLEGAVAVALEAPA